jgi:hypothetical protein
MVSGIVLTESDISVEESKRIRALSKSNGKEDIN